MSLSIHTIALGFDNAYLIKDEGAVLIDAGEPRKGEAFLRALQSASIDRNDIQLIILTHGHWDHIAYLVMLPSSAWTIVA